MLHDKQHVLVYTSYSVRETLLDTSKQAGLKLLLFYFYQVYHLLWLECFSKRKTIFYFANVPLLDLYFLIFQVFYLLFFYFFQVTLIFEQLLSACFLFFCYFSYKYIYLLWFFYHQAQQFRSFDFIKKLLHIYLFQILDYPSLTLLSYFSFTFIMS